jgi:ferredoxin--NADP+ reductase
MAYVITQRCVNDTSCIAACPVDCIRPTPGDPEFTSAEMLYIDPDVCINCGACADACPVDAVRSEDELVSSLARFREVNSEFFQRHPLRPRSESRPAHIPADGLRVAVVGAGPAGCYAAEALLAHRGVEVEMFEKLPTPWGLVRSGVAPDHQGTKTVVEMFEKSFDNNAFQYHLNVEVGRDVTLTELLRYHHAVIYAVGASADPGLNIPGEELPGSHSALEFVSWYNGHPDYADRHFDLSGERAVIVGNGNVALDIARVLTSSPDDLARTDIADHALDVLRDSNIREVVVLGRRGHAYAAYTSPEFMALQHLRDVDVVVDEDELKLDSSSQAAVVDPNAEHWFKLKVQLAREYARRRPPRHAKRILFRYLASPIEIAGGRRVESIQVARNEIVQTDTGIVARPTEQMEQLDCSLVLRSIGYRGEPVGGMPFDEDRGVVPNDHGRVMGDHGPMSGVYVAGWIKRGPRGVIGTNRHCAQQTVDQLLDDFAAGRLADAIHGREALNAFLDERQPQRIPHAGWNAIDHAERVAGRLAGRPRVKLTDRADMIAIGAGLPG